MVVLVSDTGTTTTSSVEVANKPTVSMVGVPLVVDDGTKPVADRVDEVVAGAVLVNVGDCSRVCSDAGSSKPTMVSDGVLTAIVRVPFR